jgi:uncharacterized membrane protein YdjX (TVP38/TMEM64 family)
MIDVSASLWLRMAAGVLLVACLLAAWTWIPRSAADIEALAASAGAHRYEWYVLPVVMLTFVVLGLLLVPVMLLVAATGVAFGPWLGPVYAMAGCLASGSIGFAIGRLVGMQRVQLIGGDRLIRVTRALNRNGTLAVFLIRKVPAPFTLVNIVVGASTVRYRDFVIGTLLGMGALVVGLAGVGYQIAEAFQDPKPRTLLNASMFVLVPLTLALVINHALRARSQSRSAG